MRRLATMVSAGLLVVAVTGCSSSASTQPKQSTQLVVLGTSSSADGQQQSASDAQTSVRDHTFPPAAFSGKPGASAIAVASGATAIASEQAVKLALPAQDAAVPSVHLVSAVHVDLPAAFVAAVARNRPAKPTSAWAVTYTGVPLKHAVPASATTAGLPGTVSVGDRTVLLDSETGAVIATSEYATP